MVTLLDDYLLRDLLAQNVSADLARVLDRQEPATTNLYLYRLSKSAVSARGGALTGSWPTEYRRELGRRLLELPESVQVVPCERSPTGWPKSLALTAYPPWGAEAAAAAEYLSADLAVWERDDGPRIRSAVAAVGARYRTGTR